jgi:P-type E1-E2 ATPase
MTNWICFDKTGTLTEDFMDFNCLVLCRNKKFRHQITNVAFTIPKTDDKEEIRRSTLTQRNQRLSVILSNHEDILLALNNMAMNHTIVNVEETKENVGDPMEIKLF